MLVFFPLHSCAYVLICESDENRLLAESILNTITRLMSDHVTSLEQKNAEVWQAQSRHYVLTLPALLSLFCRLCWKPRKPLPYSTCFFQMDSCYLWTIKLLHNMRNNLRSWFQQNNYHFFRVFLHCLKTCCIIVILISALPQRRGWSGDILHVIASHYCDQTPLLHVQTAWVFLLFFYFSIHCFPLLCTEVQDGENSSQLVFSMEVSQ